MKPRFAIWCLIGLGWFVLAAPASAEEIHQVRQGETLSKIAHRYGVSVKEIREANRLSSTKIRAGRALLIPTRDPEPVPGPSESSQPDTLLDEQAGSISALTEPQEASLLEQAVRAFLGVPYRFGGSSSRGIDCSAFVQKVFHAFSIVLPRTAREQYQVGTPVSKEELAVGDLVFFRTYRRDVSHVGIYVGDDRFAHASRKDRKVAVSSLNHPYYAKRYLGARRVMEAEALERSQESEVGG
ncbi:MAG: peptidoglycan endopeptidase [Nitrospirae bacterium]|nr:peptidoglycan endopeptidase [Nitrospirota bacterium]